MSEEHVWPQWAHPLLPKSSGHERYVLTGIYSDPAMTVAKHRKREGSVATVRIKRVCRTCNGGWMGTLEEQIRPFLSRIADYET